MLYNIIGDHFKRSAKERSEILIRYSLLLFLNIEKGTFE